MYMARSDKQYFFGPRMLRNRFRLLVVEGERANAQTSGPAKERVRSGQWSRSLGIMGVEEKTFRLSSQAKKEKSSRRTRSVVELE